MIFKKYKHDNYVAVFLKRLKNKKLNPFGSCKTNILNFLYGV